MRTGKPIAAGKKKPRFSYFKEQVKVLPKPSKNLVQEN